MTLLCILLVGLLALPALVWGQAQVINGNRVHAGWVNYGTTAGTSTAYTLTFTPALSGYVTGQCFLLKPHVTNTGAATVDVQGKGPKALRKLEGVTLVPLVANDLVSGRLMQVCYDGTDLQLMGSAPDAVSSGGVTDSDKGDITVSLGGTDWRIDAGAVTYMKLQQTTAPSVLLGRGSTSAGVPQEISLGSGLSISGTTLSVTAGGGNVSNTGTPADNQVAVWTSPSQVEGTAGLTYSGGTLGVGTGGTVGKLAIAGNTSGVVTVQPQAAAGTYNLNLPTSAGVLQQVLTSGGGGTTPMLWTTLAPSATTDTTNAANVTSGALPPARIAMNALSYDKLQALNAVRLLGRGPTGAGSPEEISLGPGLTMTGTTLNTVAAAGSGIVCDGVTMASTAIQNLLDTVPVGTRVVLPAGVCLLNQTLTIPKTLTLEGAGVTHTILRQTVANIPGITLGGFNDVHLTGFTIEHAGTAVEGGDGIVIGNAAGLGVNTAYMSNIAANANWRGFVLGCTAYGWGGHLQATYNNWHGFDFNYNFCNVSQWQIHESASSLNRGYGFGAVNSTGDTAGIGPFLYNTITFANDLGGYTFYGTAGHTINDIHLHNVLSSTDNRFGILLDTWGGGHIVSSPWVETSGMANFPIGTPQTTQTPAPGHCVTITPNNVSGLVIHGGFFWACAWSGVVLGGPQSGLVGGHSAGSGQAMDPAVTRRAHVVVNASGVLVTGHTFTDPGATTLKYLEIATAVNDSVIGLNTYGPGLPASNAVPWFKSRGQATITGAVNTVTVPLTPPEPDGNYLVQVTTVAAVPGAALGALTLVGVTKAVDNFVITVTAAPGAGTSVTYDWLVYR